MTERDLQLPPMTSNPAEPTRPLDMADELDRSTLWALAADNASAGTADQ